MQLASLRGEHTENSDEVGKDSSKSQCGQLELTQGRLPGGVRAAERPRPSLWMAVPGTFPLSVPRSLHTGQASSFCQRMPLKEGPRKCLMCSGTSFSDFSVAQACWSAVPFLQALMTSGYTSKRALMCLMTAQLGMSHSPPTQQPRRRFRM